MTHNHKKLSQFEKLTQQSSTSMKAYLDAIWNEPGVLCPNHYTQWHGKKVRNAQRAGELDLWYRAGNKPK